MIIDFKKSQRNQIVAVNGNFSELVPFTVIENLLFSNSLQYNIGELDDSIPSEKAGEWLAKNKRKYPAPPKRVQQISKSQDSEHSLCHSFDKGSKDCRG